MTMSAQLSGSGMRRNDAAYQQTGSGAAGAWRPAGRPSTKVPGTLWDLYHWTGPQVIGTGSRRHRKQVGLNMEAGLPTFSESLGPKQFQTKVRLDRAVENPSLRIPSVMMGGRPALQKQKEAWRI